MANVTYPRTLSLEKKAFFSLPLRNKLHLLLIQCAFFVLLRLPSYFS